MSEKDKIIEDLKEYLVVCEFTNSKLENENTMLKNNINELTERINQLQKENNHFKSTKAYKVWDKYRRFKD